MASEVLLPLMVNSVAATAGSGDTKWMGGRGTFMAEATFGGGSVKLQYKTPNGTFVDIGTGGSLTANGLIGFELPPGELKVVVVTATAVYAYVIGSRVQ